MSDFISAQVSEYLESLAPERPPELQEMEAYARKHRFPIIGPAVGHLCYQLTRMIAARRVFELGSGYGYSTAFFARAVRENGGGVVHHVVWDEELSKQARGHLTALGYADIVQYQVSEAVDALARTDDQFDVIFNDIDKEAYPQSLAIIEAKLRPGGLLIVDNTLWSGRIFDPEDTSASTEGVREFTRLIGRSPKWIASVIPIRDGVTVAYRT